MADEKKEASGIAAEAGMTSHEAEANEAIEWWHPATMLLSSTCTNCKAKLEQQEANSEQQQQRGSGGKGACSRCHRAFYCGPECQREHWKSTHKDTCRASVHLNKDLEIYANFTKESPAAVVDLQRLAYPGHLLRAEADKRWEKKDWKGAADAYGRALQSIKDTKEQAQIVAKDHGLELMFQNIAKFQFEQNGARIKSNLVACHLQLAIPKLEKIIRGPKGPATDGDRLVALIKHFEIGPGEGLSFLDDIFKDAREAMCEDDGVGYHWWKLHYRDAQLYHCTLRYEKAMEYIGRARDLINKKSLATEHPCFPVKRPKRVL